MEKITGKQAIEQNIHILHVWGMKQNKSYSFYVASKNPEKVQRKYKLNVDGANVDLNENYLII